MTEVDAVLPDGVTLSNKLTATNDKTAAAEEDTITDKNKSVFIEKANEEDKPSKAQEIGNNNDNSSNSTSCNSNSISNSNNNEDDDDVVEKSTSTLDSIAKRAEQMEVESIDDTDEEDEEENESQITESTENKLIGGTPTVDDDDDDVRKPTPTSTAENTREDEVVQAKSTTESCEIINVTKDIVIEDESQEESTTKSTPTTEVTEGDEDSLSRSDSQPIKQPTTTDSTSLSDVEAASLDSVSNGHEAVIATDALKASNGADESMDTTDVMTAQPTKVLDNKYDDLQLPKESQKKENGIVCPSDAIKKAIVDDGIVDLDSDEDEEMQDLDKEKHMNSENSNGADKNLLMALAARTINEYDDAVVIGSDSESEMDLTDKKPVIPMTTAPQPQPQAPTQTHTQTIEDDDDDDDCVVIEDDSPAPTMNDSNKRKNQTLDGLDEFPPNKRQRSLTPVGAANQLTIKDARTLMPQDAAAAIVKKDNIFPVTITSALPTAAAIAPQGPPKLVPMSSPSSMLNPPPTLGITGLPNIMNNANLLPGLTDDMFVLEAPSFIVPYIYEKPPAENIKEIILAIESTYELSKDDLEQVDKSDEFDMMTEQNKDEKVEAGGADNKKKKKRGVDENDDSWSEQSEEDDDEDDDDSESGMRTKVLIKEANDDLSALKVAIKPNVATVAQMGDNNACKPGQENYFESPLGKFFMDIGVGLVQEYVQSDLLRLQKRKLRKSLGRSLVEFERPIAALSGNLLASRKRNAPFKFTLKRCEFCNFKSESALSMANHYETPHMNGVLYRCNFCTYEIRNATEIVYHMEAVHNIKARLIKPLPYHQCPNCGFEDNGKAKLGRHQPVCAKKFRPELNLTPPTDWEAPAKIPRIKPRHGLVGTATAYQAMAAQAAAQKAALASIQAQQAQANEARRIQAAAIAAQNAAKMRARAPPVNKPAQQQQPNMGNLGGNMMRGANQAVRNPMATNVVLPNNYQLAAGQLVQQSAANAMSKKPISGQPSISITPLPRQTASTPNSSPSTSKMPPAGLKPGQSPSGGNKAQFVICEICDGYIKDLEQLRNHMQWMHKVKIHPKMIYNRPPLNCQKCQFRFFTDQGLERHLLGSHGLVTSSMQEAANKGKDAGRCPVCGRMYQWKLLNHVSRDHHMTLKPAHLSYKCTVCTATFGMYKQFETHVYTAHSTVAKKAMDSKKNNAPASAGSNSNQQRNSLGMNDPLLKPLKINDEITIIPQPASKPRITNMESHVID